MVDTDPLLTAKEGADLFQVSLATYWRRVKDRTIPPALKIGGASRWPKSDLVRLIDQKKATRFGYSVARTSDGTVIVADPESGLSASGLTVDDALAELRRLLDQQRQAA